MGQAAGENFMFLIENLLEPLPKASNRGTRE
jgi:hypothetical protein